MKPKRTFVVFSLLFCLSCGQGVAQEIDSICDHQWQALVKDVENNIFMHNSRNVVKNQLGKLIEWSKNLSVSITYSKGNSKDYLVCKYGDTPYTGRVLLFTKKEEYELKAFNGVCALPTIEDSVYKVQLSGFRPHCDPPRYAARLFKQLDTSLAFEFKNERFWNRNIFYVPKDSMYWAAFKSNEIPDFEILSNSETLNLASCIKTIFDASGVNVRLEKILDDFLEAELFDPHYELTKSFEIVYYSDDTLSYTRNSVSVFSEPIEVQSIVFELTNGRHVIGIDKNGDPYLLTAISFTSEEDGEHAHKVKMRSPSICNQQKIEMDWNIFTNVFDRIVIINILVTNDN